MKDPNPQQERAAVPALVAEEASLSLATLERSGRMGVWLLDVESGQLHWSDEACRIHGIAPGTQPKTVEAMYALYAPASATRLRQALTRVVESGHDCSLELELARPGGMPAWVQLVTQSRQPGGRVNRVVGSIIDLRPHHAAEQRRKQLEEDLERQRYRDTLTGLPNRATLQSEIALRLSRGGQQDAGLWFLHLDLDRFKLINQTCGYDAGDRLLLQLVERLSRALQAGDWLARIHGDSFAVLMAAATSYEVERRARVLIERVMSFYFEHQKRSLSVGLSIGAVALDAETLMDADTVLRQGEVSCQVAKQRGGNRVVLYQRGDTHLAGVESDQIWGGQILQALDEDRFELFAQRIVNIDSQSAPGYEILLRMRQRDGKYALPGLFLPAAHRYGLMTTIDQCVVEMVLKQCEAGLFERYPCRYVSVNLSAPSYCDEAFVDFLMAALVRSGVPPEKLRFEMTETENLPDIKVAQMTMLRLSSHGFRVMLDDFGNGFTSFGYLRRLNVGGLKIDNSYTYQLDKDPFNQAVVACVCDLCEQLRMELVVEGVETTEALDVLRQFNVRHAQGWLFHRPEPLAQALAGWTPPEPDIDNPALADPDAGDTD